MLNRDSHISFKQPLGLGRIQGWGLWADKGTMKHD